MFEAYLKFRQVPAQNEKRRKALFDQYMEREALACAIGKENLPDKDLVQAELNEFRKEMLISRKIAATPMRQSMRSAKEILC